MAINKSGKKLFEISLRESAFDSFGKFLLASLNTIDYTKLKGNILSFHCTIPPSLCRVYNPQTNQGILSTAAILALFDEFSSNSLLIKNKSNRGGVSIHLTTEILKHAKAGQDIIIQTKADKIGKIIGFCSMEMMNTDGELLARGKHIKFLPIGMLFDVLRSPILFPFVNYLYDTFRGNKLITRVDHVLGITNQRLPIPEQHDLGHLFKELEIKHVDNIHEYPWIESKHSQDYELYQFKVKRYMTNILKKMHGGAIATAIEEACMQSKLKFYPHDKENTLLILRSIDIRYFSPVNGEIMIQLEHDIASDIMVLHNSMVHTERKRWHEQMIGSLYTIKNKQRCAEFVCTWEIFEKL